MRAELVIIALGVFAIVVGNTLAASFDEDRRCGTQPQAREQEKLDELYRRYLDDLIFASSGPVIGGFYHHEPSVFENNYWDPLFPGHGQDTWDELRALFNSLNPSKLDPYDYKNAKVRFDRATPTEFYVTPGSEMPALCANWLDEYELTSGDQSTLYRGFTAWYDCQGDSKQQYGCFPVYDATTFAALVDKIDGVTDMIDAKVDGDYWTRVYEHVSAHAGGFFRVNDVLNQIFDMYDLAFFLFDSSLELDNPIVSSIIDRGYTPSSDELDSMYEAMQRASAAALRFENYSNVVGMPLGEVVPTVWPGRAAINWRLHRGIGDECKRAEFYTQSTLTEDEAMDMFTTWQSRVDQQIAEIDQYFADHPELGDYYGYNMSFLLFLDTKPEGFETVVDWGVPEAHCEVDPNTGYMLFDTLVDTATARYLDARNRGAYVHSPLSAHRVRNISSFGTPCTFGAGNSFVDDNFGMFDRFPHANAGYQALDSPYTTMSVVVHEQAHVDQLTFGHASCETCYTRRYGARRTYFGLAGMGADSNLVASLEGPAAYAEDRVGEAMEVYTEQEHIARLFWDNEIRSLYSIIRLGFILGEFTIDDAALYYQTHSFFPYDTFDDARSEFELQYDNYWAQAGLTWYGVGRYLMDKYRAEAQETCGDAFDEKMFYQAHYSHGGPLRLPVLREMYRDYIDAGCSTSINKYGDCHRTVQPVRNANGAYNP